MKIAISSLVHSICPDLVLGIIEGKVKSSPASGLLWQEMEKEMKEILSNYSLGQINKRPTILAIREAYKKLGKDPSRYRPSAEALCRRICKGNSIYQINTLVDIINLVSIRSGFSIGGFDADKIQGNLLLDIGNENDKFEAIGRGILNVTGLPLFRDEVSGIGTPTSDNERTKITMETNHLLMIINAYGGKTKLEETIDYTVDLLKKYAEMTEYDIFYIK